MPPDCPSNDDRQNAFAYWKEKRRSDLIGNIETIVEQFRAHHEARGTKMVNWSAAWRTWYVNQVQFSRKVDAPFGGNVRADQDRRHKHIVGYLRTGEWPKLLGQEPGKPNSQVPIEVVRQVAAELGVANIKPSVLTLLKETEVVRAKA